MVKGHPIFAFLYDWLMLPSDWLTFRAYRQGLVASASGKVLELGIGTGLNLPFYQEPKVVVGTDPDPHMLKQAYFRALKSSMSVELFQNRGEELPFKDGSFDTVISTLVFCTIPDPMAATKEIQRVLKKGGSFLFLEHVRSAHPHAAKIQDKITPLWKRLLGGCHPNRDTLALFRKAGFKILELQDFNKGFSLLPLIVGRAEPGG